MALKTGKMKKYDYPSNKRVTMSILLTLLIEGGRKKDMENYLCIKRGEADMPLFETIKTNLGTQPKIELQQ